MYPTRSEKSSLVNANEAESRLWRKVGNGGKQGLNSVFCRDCNAAVFYGGIFAVFYISLYRQMKFVVRGNVSGNTIEWEWVVDESSGEVKG